MVHEQVPGMELSNEYKLLLLCARTRMTEEIEEKIKSLIQYDIDWEHLLHISSKHRLTPLLYWQLNSVCPDSVPSDVIMRLKNYFHENTKKNLLFMGELLRILKLFKSHGITAIPYKGPILAILAYGNLILRNFDDLDIFVPKNEVLKAKNLLISNGYKIQFDPKGIKERFYFYSQRDYQFYNPDKNINLEIHWNFIGLSFSCKSNLFKNPKNLKFIEIYNSKILSLSTEDMLLILCIHASGHQWERLSWLCDIAEFIRSNNNIDWLNLFEKVELIGFKRILQINIILAVEIFDLEIHDQVLDQMNRDKFVKSLYDDIKSNIMNPMKQKGVLNKALLRLNIREKRSDKIKDFLKIILSHYIFSLYQL